MLERVGTTRRLRQKGNRKELRRRLEGFFDRYADPQYDLRRGGTSKTQLLSRRPRDGRSRP